MPQIDPFVDVLFKYSGDELVLKAQEKATLSVCGMPQDISATALSAEQVVGLLREMLPPDCASAAAAQEDFDFAYAAPEGPVMVKVNWQSSVPSLTLERNLGAIKRPTELRPPIDATDAAGKTSVAISSNANAPDKDDLQAQSTTSVTTLSASAPTAPTVAASSFTPPTRIADGAREQIDKLFRLMADSGASDLHIASDGPVLFRQDGTLKTLAGNAVIGRQEAEQLLYSITPADKRLEFESDMDTDFSYEIDGIGRFRCNLFLDRRGIGGAFRLIPLKIPNAEEIGLSPTILNFCNLHKGMVIVTGPTGSGKSTTLAAMIDYINQRQTSHIITIEDPIEFVYKPAKSLITQREVRTHTHSFKSALRAALREDPDIILVGEMRDLETISIALETAETGHLVFGTLHTNTASSAVDRIIDQFPSDQQNQVRIMLAASLKGVIAQALCKKKTGGRVAAHEVLISSGAISNLIREGKTFQLPSVMQTGKAAGMQTLNDSLLQLAKDDVIEGSEAYSKSAAREEFKVMAQRHGVELNL